LKNLLEKKEKIMSFKKKITESKITPCKKTLELKNISVKDLKLIDTDTGEDITEAVIAEIPTDVDVVDFKLVFELPDEE
jgi:hypothetical protein